MITFTVPPLIEVLRHGEISLNIGNLFPGIGHVFFFVEGIVHEIGKRFFNLPGIVEERLNPIFRVTHLLEHAGDFVFHHHHFLKICFVHAEIGVRSAVLPGQRETGIPEQHKVGRRRYLRTARAGNRHRRDAERVGHGIRDPGVQILDRGDALNRAEIGLQRRDAESLPPGVVFRQRRVLADFFNAFARDRSVRQKRPLPVRHHAGNIHDGPPFTLSGCIQSLVCRGGKVIFQGNYGVCGNVPLDTGINPLG